MKMILNKKLAATVLWLTSATVRTKYMDGCCGSMPSSFIPCLKPFFTVGTLWDWNMRQQQKFPYNKEMEVKSA